MFSNVTFLTPPLCSLPVATACVLHIINWHRNNNRLRQWVRTDRHRVLDKVAVAKQNVLGRMSELPPSKVHSTLDRNSIVPYIHKAVLHEYVAARVGVLTTRTHACGQRS